jgi:hypothetical protein
MSACHSLAPFKKGTSATVAVVKSSFTATVPSKNFASFAFGALGGVHALPMVYPRADYITRPPNCGTCSFDWDVILAVAMIVPTSIPEQIRGHSGQRATKGYDTTSAPYFFAPPNPLQYCLRKRIATPFPNIPAVGF